MSPAFFNLYVVDVDALFNQLNTHFPGEEYDIGKAYYRNYVWLVDANGIGH